MRSLYILCINPLSDNVACKNFLLFCSLCYHICYLCCTFIWCSVICQFLLLLLVLFDVLSKQLLPRPMPRNIFPTFSCRRFVIPGLMFKSYMHIQLIFVSAVRWGPNTLFCMCLSGFPNAIFWLPIGCSWIPCRVLVHHINRRLNVASLVCVSIFVPVAYDFIM